MMSRSLPVTTADDASPVVVADGDIGRHDEGRHEVGDSGLPCCVVDCCCGCCDCPLSIGTPSTAGTWDLSFLS